MFKAVPNRCNTTYGETVFATHAVACNTPSVQSLCHKIGREELSEERGQMGKDNRSRIQFIGGLRHDNKQKKEMFDID